MSKYLIFMIVGVLLGLLILLCMLRHRRTQRRELETKARDQLREEALNRALMNDRANEREVSAKRCLPYEVDYGQNKNSVNSLSQNKKMLHIIENSELSVRKYLFDPNQKIHIGSKSDINEIVIKDRTVSGQHCEIAVYKNEAILAYMIKILKEKAIIS